MRFTLLLLLLFIWILNQILSFASQTVTTKTTETTEVLDLQDGHPNHRLWQKMIDTGRLSSGDWYVNNFDLFYNLFCHFLLLPFCSELCSLIKLI
jgi:hypothetical protein